MIAAWVVQECKVLSGPLAGRTIKRRIYSNPEADAIRQAITAAAYFWSGGAYKAGHTRCRRHPELVQAAQTFQLCVGADITVADFAIIANVADAARSPSSVRDLHRTDHRSLTSRIRSRFFDFIAYRCSSM